MGGAKPGLNGATVTGGVSHVGTAAGIAVSCFRFAAAVGCKIPVDNAVLKQLV
jgi:hypothetical protein